MNINILFALFLCHSLTALNMFQQGEEIQRNELKTELVSINRTLNEIFAVPIEEVFVEDTLNSMLNVLTEANKICENFISKIHKGSELLSKIMKFKHDSHELLHQTSMIIGNHISNLSQFNKTFDLLSLSEIRDSELFTRTLPAAMNQLQHYQIQLLNVLYPEDATEEEPKTEIIIIPATENDENIAQGINLEQNLIDSGMEEENNRLRMLIECKRLVNDNTNEDEHLAQGMNSRQNQIDSGIGAEEKLLGMLIACKMLVEGNTNENAHATKCVADNTENTNEKIVRVFGLNQHSNHGEELSLHPGNEEGNRCGLPNEIWSQIVSYLEVEDLKNFRGVCHFANYIVLNEKTLPNFWLNSSKFSERMLLIKRATGFTGIGDNLAVSYFSNNTSYCVHTTDSKFVKVWYRSDRNLPYSLIESIEITEAVERDSDDRIKPWAIREVCANEPSDDTFTVITEVAHAPTVYKFLFKLGKDGFRIVSSEKISAKFAKAGSTEDRPLDLSSADAINIFHTESAFNNLVKNTENYSVLAEKLTNSLGSVEEDTLIANNLEVNPDTMNHVIKARERMELRMRSLKHIKNSKTIRSLVFDARKHEIEFSVESEIGKSCSLL